MTTLRQHPALLNSSPSFDEDDYSQSTDYSYSQTSIQSSMTGSFRDDYSVGDSEDPVRKPLTPFHNSLSTLAGLSSSRKSTMPFGMQSPGTKAKKKADVDRAKRTIERLNQAEMQLKMKVGCYPEDDGDDDAKKKSSKKGEHNKSDPENPEIKLKLSQIDIARNFYQRRINQNSVMAGPVPLEILNIVKSVSAPPQQPTSNRAVV